MFTEPGPACAFIPGLAGGKPPIAPLVLGRGGESHYPGKPVGAGTLPAPQPHQQPGPAGKGNMCLCLGEPGLVGRQAPLPPLLFIAFHQHLELEPLQRWLRLSRGMELGGTCAGRREGRRE